MTKRRCCCRSQATLLQCCSSLRVELVRSLALRKTRRLCSLCRSFTQSLGLGSKEEPVGYKVDSIGAGTNFYLQLVNVKWSGTRKSRRTVIFPPRSCVHLKKFPGQSRGQPRSEAPPPAASPTCTALSVSPPPTMQQTNRGASWVI